MAHAWWASAVSTLLSQGDVIKQVLIGRPDRPVKWAAKTSIKGTSGWVERPDPAPDASDITWFLGKARYVPALILSYGCEVAKQKRWPRVLVAPIFSIGAIQQPEVREAVLRQQVHHSMPLPDLPTLGDCYADFRQTTFIDRDAIDLNDRIASLSDAGLERMWVQLMAFFTRREPTAWSPPMDGQ